MKDNNVYAQSHLEFITIAVAYCSYLEEIAEESALDFVRKTDKILPLLYLKASLVEIPERLYEEGVESFVTEEEYESKKEEIANLLGRFDAYLETVDDEMQFSDTPIVATISENLTDVYQDVKDFAMNYRLGNEQVMNDALANCMENFQQYWGQKLLNALRALHMVLYKSDIENETKIEENSTKKKENFVDFLRHDESDYSQLL